MTRTIRAAAFVAAAFFSGGVANAQDRPGVSLTSAAPATWDVAGHIGWLGSNKAGVGAEWDDWYNAPAGGLTVGHYLTPHFKAEIQAAFSGEGRIFDEQPIPVPGQAFPIFRSREHYFSATTVSGGVSRQFFENQWFHPFVGGGLEVVREQERIETLQQFVPGPDPRVPVVIPALVGAESVRWAARPYVTTGFKWYVSQRGFVRGDLRVSISNQGAQHVVWAAGAGIDF